MSAPKLRPVADGEQAPPKTAKSVLEAAKDGTHLELLVAMRDRIAAAVADPKCPPRDLAALTRRLADVAEQIKEIREAAADADDQGDAGDHYDAAAI